MAFAVNVKQGAPARSSEPARLSSLVLRARALDRAWRPRSPFGASVRVASSDGSVVIGLGEDAQDALEQALMAAGWSGAEVSVRRERRRFGPRALWEARGWVRSLDRKRLLERRGTIMALESIAKLLVQDALSGGSKEDDGR